MFMSLSLCDLCVVLSCRQCTLKSVFCGSMEGVTLLFTTDASETHVGVIAIIKRIKINKIHSCCIKSYTFVCAHAKPKDNGSVLDDS